MELKEHEPLASHTTFHLGGPARYFVEARSLEEIQESIDFARDQNKPVFVLGGGSNVLAADEGFDGLVIKIELNGLEQRGRVLVAGAGEPWDAVVSFAVSKHLWGIENLSGIPGTVGGAVVQNIGAYGAALSQTLQSVDVFDTTANETRTLSAEQCRFGYRGSIFKEEEGQYVVLSAALALSDAPSPNVSYKDLKARFGGAAPGLADIRSAVLDIRARKFPDLTKEGTAGSFFKNPIMSTEDAAALKRKYPEIPLFEMPETAGIKVPLAWLLDHALRLQGARVGGARLFEKQILVIAAGAGATARDVQELAALVEKKVSSDLNIHIEPEVKIL